MTSVLAYDPLINNPAFQNLFNKRAKQAGVELTESLEEAVMKSKILFVAVPTDKAAQVSEDIKEYLSKDVLYIDVSASSPNTQKIIAKNIEEYTSLFVDASMLGPLIKYQHKVPMLISGKGADYFQEKMSKFGMNLTKVSESPGDASAIKLIRSIFMKGLATISLETFDIARELNLEDYVLNSLKLTIENSTFEDTINQLITGTSIHAERRSKEMEGSIEMLDSLGINSILSHAIKEKLLYITDLNLKAEFNGERPNDWFEVIDSIKRKRKVNNQMEK